MTDNMEQDEASVRADFVDKIKQAAKRIPFASEAATAYYCGLDPTTPKHAKAIILGALAYFILPLDALPDFIAALGYTDDATVFWAAYRQLTGHITERHKAQAAQLLDNELNTGPDKEQLP